MNEKVYLPLDENQEYYYINKKIQILKICMSMHIARIKIRDTGEEILVDASAVSKSPIREHSVSIKWLGGK